MKVVYIAGPYRAKTVHGMVCNIRKAEKVALKYWKKGYAVICPHTNTALMDGYLPDEVWLKGDIEIIKRCDVLVAMKGWKYSHGATNEVNTARALGKKIIFDR